MRKSRTPKGETKRVRSAKRAAVTVTGDRAKRLAAAKGQVLVNVSNLRPTNSYDIPPFVSRGFYVDQPFTCKDCGVDEIWRGAQQKWWYEIAKGDLATTAVRCRACRRRERERKALARKTQSEGAARKRERAA